MLNVLFFAQTRELIGIDAIQVEDDFSTAEAVREHLAQKGDKWALARLFLWVKYAILI